MSAKKVIVCGAGGHCRVVLDILLAGDEYEPVGLLCEESCDVLGVPVIGTDDDMARIYSEGIRCAFVAIGNGRIREKVTEALLRTGFQLINVISPRAIVSAHAQIGQGVLVNHGAIVNAGAVIHDGAILNTGCTVDHDSEIGRFAHIAPGVHICGKSRVGDRTLMGVGSCMIDGVSVGSDSVVGAGAAVVRPLPDRCLALGVPAKVHNNL